MQSRELNCFALKPHIFLKHRIEVQGNSMDKNADQCSAVKCTAAHTRLNQIPQRRRKTHICFFFSLLFGASISISREIWCLPYVEFFFVKTKIVLGFFLMLVWILLFTQCNKLCHKMFILSIFTDFLWATLHYFTKARARPMLRYA